MKLRSFLFAMLGMMVAGSSAQATIIYTEDFQTPAWVDGGAGFPTGWTEQVANGGSYNPQDAQYPGATGNSNQFGWVGVFAGGTERTNASTVGTLAANSIYTPDYILGNRADFGYPADAFLEIHATAFNGTTLASVNIGTNGGLVPADGAVSGVLQLALNSASFAGEVGNDLVIVFRTAVTGQLNIDNLSLNVVPVPEPSTLTMMLFGTVGLWLMRRKQTE